jgi:hypothetical protein
MEIRDREAECNFAMALETSSLTRSTSRDRELALLVYAKLWGAWTAMTRLWSVIVTSLLDCPSTNPTLSSCAALYHRPSIATFVCHWGGNQRSDTMQLELPALIVTQSEYSSHDRTNGHRCYSTLPRLQVPIPVAAWPEHKEERSMRNPEG